MKYDKYLPVVAQWDCERAVIYADSYKDAKLPEKRLTVVKKNQKYYARIGGGQTLYYIAGQELFASMVFAGNFEQWTSFTLMSSTGKNQRWAVIAQVKE